MPNPWEMDWGNQAQAAPGPVIVGTPRPPNAPSGFSYDASPRPLTPIPGGPNDPNNPNNPAGNQRFDNINNLRKQFEGEQAVQDYKTILPLEASALHIENNKAGDLNLVYAFGKVMDPGSVVREGEQVMATNVGGVSEKVKGYLAQIDGQGQLTPSQRLELIEEIRNRARQTMQAYNQRRAFYTEFAQRNNISPEDIVGPHPGEPFRAGEEEYIRAHGGTPKFDGMPLEAPTRTQVHFGDERGDPPLPPHSDDFRNGLYNAMRSGQIRNPNDMRAWVQQFNQQNGTNFTPQFSNADTMRAIQAARQGRAFDVEQPRYTPDISDVRGGENSAMHDASEAGIRGIADSLSIGALDKIVAGTDTLFKGGTMDENLARQYAISDYDSANHPYYRLFGQAVGGTAIPLGRVGSLTELAAKGGALGAAYGVGSSRSLSDVPGNAVLGGIAGAAVPTAIVGAGKGLGALVGRQAPRTVELVDSATGELNQPMDAMSPAQRVAEMRDLGMETITPGMVGGRSARVLEQGLNNLPGSAGVMEDINSAASGELRRSMQGVAQQFGSSKTLTEGGAEMQRGARERIDRAVPVIERAYNAIPIAESAPASRSSTIATLQGLTGRFQSNPKLAETLRDPKMAAYLEAFQSGNLSWKDLKDFRSIIGEKIGEMRFGESSSTSDLRALYAALSEDMRTTAANAGQGALRAFERANNLNRQNEELIQGALTRILGRDGQLSPEKAAAAVQAMTLGGKSTGDLRTLAQIKAATVKSGAWDELASTLIHLGGQPAKSEGRAFEPATFVRWYADMSEKARGLLFKPELRKELDRFVAMNQQLSRTKGLANTSNTTPTMIGSGVLAAGGVAAFSHPSALLAIVGGGIANNVMARLWTSPKFVNLMTGYTRAYASGNPAAVQSQVGRLAKLATTNPELREGIEGILRRIANDNAPNVGSIAASPDEGPQNQAQPY